MQLCRREASTICAELRVQAGVQGAQHALPEAFPAVRATSEPDISAWLATLQNLA